MTDRNQENMAWHLVKKYDEKRAVIHFQQFTEFEQLMITDHKYVISDKMEVEKLRVIINLDIAMLERL